MADRRTFTRNAYESNLVGALNPGATSVLVDSTVGLVAPIYLVIDPDELGNREWVRVNVINGLNLESIVRNLDGSVGDVQHDAGAVIRAIFTKQHLDDLFLDIGEGVSGLTNHAADIGDPHAPAGYLKLAGADALYVNLTGDTMSGLLILSGDPVNALGAATKGYVDTLLAALDARVTTLENP